MEAESPDAGEDEWIAGSLMLKEIQPRLDDAAWVAHHYLTMAKPIDPVIVHGHRRKVVIHYQWKELYSQGFHAVAHALSAHSTIAVGCG